MARRYTMNGALLFLVLYLAILQIDNILVHFDVSSLKINFISVGITMACMLFGEWIRVLNVENDKKEMIYKICLVFSIVVIPTQPVRYTYLLFAYYCYLLSTFKTNKNIWNHEWILMC